MSDELDLKKAPNGTPPDGTTTLPPASQGDIGGPNGLQAKYDKLAAAGGGVLFIDRLYNAPRPLRMNSRNVSIRGLRGSGASRKEDDPDVGDDYNTFCGLRAAPFCFRRDRVGSDW